jgi:hypothetical protein
MSEQIWEKLRLRIGVRWLRIKKHGRELLSRSKLKSCNAKRRTRKMRGSRRRRTEGM